MDGENNAEHMWEQLKWAMFEGAKEVYGSVRERREGEPKECAVER